MPVYEVTKFSGGISDFSDRGLPGSFKFGYGLDIRKTDDTLSCKQALVDEGTILQSVSSSPSPSASRSPSSSNSPSASPSVSPSSSASPSNQFSSSKSPSASRSPSASNSPSASRSPSSSISFSPSPSATYTSIFKDLILWFVPASDGNLYGFGNTGYIYKRTLDGTWSIVYKSASKIKGAEEKPSSGGKTYLIWALNTEIHRKEIPGNAQWNDVDAAGSVQGDTWPKNNLTSTDWHTMKVVGGDVMIANKSTLAMAAYDDSYTNEALDLIPGNTAKTLVERNGRVITGTYRTADPDKGINAAIDAEIPIAQVGDDGNIFYANMVDSVATKRLPGGGKVNPGAITNEVDQVNFFEWEVNSLSWIDKQVVGNMALLGVYDADSGMGGVYSFGRNNKNHPLILNLDYLLDVDEIGAVVHYNGLTFVSYRDTNDFGVKVTSTTTKATGVWEGLEFRSPVRKPIEINSWMQAEVYCKSLPSGCSIEFWYKLDKTGSFIKAKVADGSVSYSTTNGQKAVFRIAAAGDIFEPRIVLNPTGNTSPEVLRLRVYFN